MSSAAVPFKRINFRRNISVSFVLRSGPFLLAKYLVKQGVARRGFSIFGSTPKSTARSFNWFLHRQLPAQWQELEQPEPNLRHAQRKVQLFVHVHAADG